jgi:hypothetical protein
MAFPARLARSLHQTLGDEAAEDLVNWMEHMDANRAELRELIEIYSARSDSRFADLRHALDAGFAKVDTRFAHIDTRFEQIDARFARLEASSDARFAQVDTRFAQLEGKSDAQFARFEGKLAEFGATLEAKFERRFADLLKWSFVFWVGAVGAIATLAHALK